MNTINGQALIFTSCYYKKSVNGGNIIARHAFSFQISGLLIGKDGQEAVMFDPGDFRFNVRNKLARFESSPLENEAFRSLSIPV